MSSSSNSKNPDRTVEQLALEDFGAGRAPRTIDEIAIRYRDQARYFEMLAMQSEQLLRSYGILPRYTVPGLTPAYIRHDN